MILRTNDGGVSDNGHSALHVNVSGDCGVASVQSAFNIRGSNGVGFSLGKLNKTIKNKL